MPVAVKLNNIGKRFNLVHHKEGAPFVNILPRVFSHNESEEFWAVKGINMEIESGRVAGIIGRNGSGKSTLLNIISGVMNHTEGEMSLGGRVSSLLTLGAGFQDDLSGRENIYINGAILGMSKREISDKYDSIVAFSELDGFLDVPIRTYSQGMNMRLAFSIATHMDFTILAIDEILSVGDVAFQKKCYERIVDFKRGGKTMLMVSQSMDIIERLCDEVYLLEDGRLVESGDPEFVVGRYMRLLNERGMSRPK
ncbi:MAG: ABC transporter ATP-binding protein [Candidatus Omnitrophica bacterium]|nr:ABC transporter ATP-binding protein [Candidatus Omnitrophota bacterium]